MSQSTTPQSIAELLYDGASRLEGLSDSPRLDCEVLLAHALNKPRSHLMAWPDKQPNLDELTRFQSLLARRTEGEPIAYLVGQREFWSLELHVNRHTLIPRPETERLVEVALSHIPTATPFTLADLGTGSGAIALAIAQERPDCQIIATDYSSAALTVAQENAHRHGITNITFFSGHWYQPIAGQRFDMIVSNPPYIAKNDPHLTQGDVRFEPTSALISGGDGLNDIRILIDEGRRHLIPGGHMIIEHGYDQEIAIRQLFTDHGYQHVMTHQDYAGIGRISEGRLP